MVAFLGPAGKQITVVTDREEFGSSVEAVHMYVLRKRMEQGEAEALSSQPFKYPVKVMQSATITEIHENEVVVVNKSLHCTAIEADDIVTCYTKPNAEILETLNAAGLPVITAGDAKSPRNLHAAVKEGAIFGAKLDPDIVINPNGEMVDNLPLDVQKELGF